MESGFNSLDSDVLKMGPPAFPSGTQKRLHVADKGVVDLWVSTDKGVC
jgi:hypothetical protein